MIGSAAPAGGPDRANLAAAHDPRTDTSRPSSAQRRQRTLRATRGRRRWVPGSWRAILWLTLLWILLWGDLSPGNVVAGAAIGLFVSTVLPLPRATGRSTFRVRGFIVLAAVFIWQVIKASAQIVVLTIMRREPRGAVVRVQMRSHSDVILTATGGMCSLVPGSLVVEALRSSGLLYMHILDVDITGGVEGAKRDILAQEERLLRAFATDDQLVDAGFRPGWSVRAGRLPAPSVEGPAADAPAESPDEATVETPTEVPGESPDEATASGETRSKTRGTSRETGAPASGESPGETRASGETDAPPSGESPDEARAAGETEATASGESPGETRTSGETDAPPSGGPAGTEGGA